MLQVPPRYMLHMLCVRHTDAINKQVSRPHSAAVGRLQRLRPRWAWSKKTVCLCLCLQTHKGARYYLYPPCTVPYKRYQVGAPSTYSLAPSGNSSSKWQSTCKRSRITKQRCVRARMVVLHPSNHPRTLSGLLVYVPAAARYSRRGRRASSISNNCIMPRDSRSWLCC